MTENGPVKKGDLIVYIKSDESGNKTSEYYICVDEAKAGTADGWSVNIVDSHNNSSNMIKGIYDAILSGSTNADLLRMIDTLVARYIAAQLIRVTGAIFGGDYTKEGFHITNPDDQKYNGRGFHLSVDGRLQASDAELNGSFECRDDTGIVLKTLYGAVGGVAVSNSKTRWDNRSFIDNFSSYFNSRPDLNIMNMISGTYSGKSVYFYVCRNRIKIEVYCLSSHRNNMDSSTLVRGIYDVAPIPFDYKAHLIGDGWSNKTHSIYLNGEKLNIDFSNELDTYVDVKKGDVFSVENIYFYYNTDFSIYLIPNTDDAWVFAYVRGTEYPFGDHGYLYVEYDVLNMYFYRRESNSNRVTTSNYAESFGNFDSDDHMTLAEITNWSNLIGNQGVTFYDLSRIYIDDIEYTPISAFVMNDIIYMQVSDGQIFSFEKYVDTSNHSSAGWYNISGYLITESEQRGVEISDLIPVDNTVQIGSSQKSFSNAYIEAITTTNLFADVLKASHINASDLPRSESEADANGIYIDENGFLKIKQ